MSRKKTNKTGIPDFVLDSLARALLPAIQKYFETEEGKKAFENWKKEHRIKTCEAASIGGAVDQLLNF